MNGKCKTMLHPVEKTSTKCLRFRELNIFLLSKVRITMGSSLTA